MKPLGRHHSARVGFTLVELLVTVLTIGLLVSLLLTALYNQKARSRLIRCTSNLKQIGMGFSTWALDEGKSLAKRGGTNGASLGFELAQPVHWFQALSNELVSPIILVCPADTRKPAPDFGSSFSNTNISYFFSMYSGDLNPEWLLSGDRNLTNGRSIENGVLPLSSNWPAGWTHELHNRRGNVLLNDGSIQQLAISRLPAALQSGATNRLALP